MAVVVDLPLVIYDINCVEGEFSLALQVKGLGVLFDGKPPGKTATATVQLLPTIDELVTSTFSGQRIESQSAVTWVSLSSNTGKMLVRGNASISYNNEGKLIFIVSWPARPAFFIEYKGRLQIDILGDDTGWANFALRPVANPPSPTEQ